MDYRRIRALTGALLGLLIADSRATAQTSDNLSSLLPDLILRDIVLPTPTQAGFSHSVHFSPFRSDDPNNPAVAIVESVNKLIENQLSAFPIGSSSGGFTYSFDPTVGTFRRGSSSFGPSFAERATTIGRRRINAGFNYQHVSYSSIEGSRLDNGSINFYLHHKDCCSAGTDPVTGAPFIQQPDGSNLTPFFEGDVIQAALTMRIKSDTFAAFGNYGLTNRWDVGVAIPIVRVSLDAQVLATIMRLSTASIPLIHTFEAGNPNATQKVFARSGTASGIGDILLRSKYRVFDMPAGGLALAVDLRLPSGDQKNLLGGSTQGKITAILSRGNDRLGEHVNIGYTRSRRQGTTVPGTSIVSTGDYPDEIGYAGGAEFVATPRLTINGDFVARTLRNAGRLDLVTKTFQYELPGPLVIPPPSQQFQEFAPRPGNLTLIFGTVGAKYNPISNLLVTGSLLFPLTNAGLKSSISPVIGFDFAF